MVTRRDRNLLILLMVQAGLHSINTFAMLPALLPPRGVVLFGLLGAISSAVTGVYVVWSREPVVKETTRV